MGPLLVSIVFRQLAMDRKDVKYSCGNGIANRSPLYTETMRFALQSSVIQLTLLNSGHDMVSDIKSVFQRSTLTNLFTAMNNMKTNKAKMEVNAPVWIVTINIYVSKFSIEYNERVRRRTPD